jgi:phosphate transport system protein
MNMFREILAILRRADLLKQAMEEAEEMLSKAELMFRTAMDMIMERKKPDMDIYERDREINRTEWEVRQKVLEHLVVGNRKEDVSVALILTSAVVDIERIGDYSKNIFELADICRREVIVEEGHAIFFREIEAQILEIFALTRDAYKEADAQKARTAMDIHWSISQRCDRMYENLALEQGLSAECAVIYTLLSRYLKRVSSHLKNIASSVVNPFPRMGFRSSEEGKDLDIG